VTEIGEPVTGKILNGAPAASKTTCEELRGHYNLWGGYTYIEEQGIKATSSNGSWKAQNCKLVAKPEGTYILEGEEETTHEVGIKINDTYELVALATNKSSSELTIDKDGRLADRRIFFPVDGELHGIPNIKELNTTGKLWKERRSYIEEKLEIYKELVRKRHEAAANNMHCIPTRGKNKDNQEVIASICPSAPNYVRVMVKRH
jgi:hypothetical protein